MMEKLTVRDGRTPNFVVENIEKLKELFPDFVTEGRIDFDAFRQTFGEYVDDREERYSFTWHGKSRARQIAQMPSMGTLRPCPDESVNWDTTKNIFIEGDNLEVLKLLQKSYHRKVKMIYIDPPYNTGKEFIYPDKWQDNLDTYLRYTGQIDDEGFKLSANSETSGRYHTNWLNMMYPRLKLARNLLTEDGFMVVSIDDHEVASLTLLLDEVLGEENRIATIVWDKARKNDAKLFSVGHDYMVIYARNREHLRDQSVILRTPKPGIEEVEAEFNRLRALHSDDWDKIRSEMRSYFKRMPSDDPRKPLARYTKVDDHGPYRDDKDISWPGGGGPEYEVLHPVTLKPCKQPRGGWRYSTPDRFWEEVENGRIAFGPDHTTVPSVRTNLFENSTQVMTTVHYRYSQTVSDQFDAIFGGRRVFDNPKHFEDLSALVAYLTHEASIVLDFFAGSGTTGHAVVHANRSHQSARRYICVQLPENIDEKTETGRNALSLGFSTISGICAERLRRIDDGSGFKFFALSSSSIKLWDADFDTMEHDLVEAIDNIKSDRSEDDVLYELLLKYGLDLAIPTETRDIEGRKVTVIGAGALIVCLADDITLEVVSGVAALKAELQPEVMRVVFKDSGFADDVAKTNAAQILRQAGIDDVKSL